MEQKTPTTPQWVEDMQKWQNENKEQRAVFCVTSSEESFRGMLFGDCLPILAALIELMEKDNDYKGLISAATAAIETPIGAMIVRAEWEKYKKKHGIKNHNDDESSNKSSIKSTLKDLFQTLADKL